MSRAQQAKPNPGDLPRNVTVRYTRGKKHHKVWMASPGAAHFSSRPDDDPEDWTACGVDLPYTFPCGQEPEVGLRVYVSVSAHVPSVCEGGQYRIASVTSPKATVLDIVLEPTRQDRHGQVDDDGGAR